MFKRLMWLHIASIYCNQSCVETKSVSCKRTITTFLQMKFSNIFFIQGKELKTYINLVLASMVAYFYSYM